MSLRFRIASGVFRGHRLWHHLATVTLSHHSNGMAWEESAPGWSLVERSIRMGSRFLASRQRDDGSFRAFRLAPGLSVGWITAHVAFVTESVPEMTTVGDAAARHLIESGPDDGGWGFNRRVAIDYDSTAQALLVLQRHGIEGPDFIHRWLRRGQGSDGGFPTYPPGAEGPLHGWQAEHPDTTQMAALYLVRHGHEEAAERAIRWLASLSTGGVTPSYWWSGPGYGWWLGRRLGQTGPPASVLEATLRSSHSVPDLAFTVSVAMGRVTGDVIDTALVRLLALQRADGSWPCAPCLRVTDQRHHRAGEDAPGRVHADTRRVLSTAHAVAALSEMRSGRPHLESAVQGQSND